MKLPRDVWWSSPLLPTAVRSELELPLPLGEGRGEGPPSVAVIAEGHGTLCPFWHFGEVYA